ncbi:MAG TPA: phosphodiester glycosidase family protein [Candidatus Absconditabacterales bacterium]|nr:phosphodiester glycosidase family protein [Candidatus Absconditabacterales bacterium]HPK28225.1 phosphodiester glycosidase family protein [Candidatus Absconditabacterales bacterium]
MKKWILAFVMLFFVGNVFAYKELLLEVRGGKPIRVIKVVLDGEHYVVTSLANNGGDTLENLVKKVGGDSGINGTFFCPDDYTSCGKVTHSNFERVYLGNGKDYSRFWPNTESRMIFGFNKDGEPMFVQNKLNERMGLLTLNNGKGLNDLYFGLANFTVLLVDGENVVEANEMHFESKMYGSANRNFICSTKDRSTIYMGIVGGINIPQLANYLKDNFECYNALALDAGASEAMVYDSNVLARSSRRRIMDAFVVIDRDQYINLTKHTPPQKEKYIPQADYEMTSKDYGIVSVFKSIIDKLIKQEGSAFRGTAIKIIREAKGMEKFKYDYQRKAIFHELLIRLYTIDKL